jgi:hypothetical protein
METELAVYLPVGMYMYCNQLQSILRAILLAIYGNMKSKLCTAYIKNTQHAQSNGS